MKLLGEQNFFDINSFGTSFRETILFEWDKDLYRQARGYPIIYPTENEHLVSKIIQLYLLRISRLFSVMKDMKIMGGFE